jgi:hypothetical protein
MRSDGLPHESDGLPHQVSARRAQLQAIPTADARLRAELDDVIAFLLIKSFQTERVQFELWCLHCAQVMTADEL